MIDIHNPRGGIDVQDYALHRTDKMVARAKIGGERDDGIGQVSLRFSIAHENKLRAR